MENKNLAPAAAGSPSDHLANERTFLAWVRTSIAIMGFGFVVVKFGLFIKQISLVLNKPGMAQPPKGYSSETGIFLVCTGIIIGVHAYARYRITERQLLQREYKPSYLLAGLVTALILVAGIVLVIYLAPNVQL